MKERRCAYCGSSVKKADKEHVIPKCLYPTSKSRSKVQRLTIPACNKCNNGWADDEAHFRNIMLLAGEPNQVVNELWNTTARRGFNQVDGQRRLEVLFTQMIPIETPSGTRHKVYPAYDERAMRVIRKIIRGLCHYHNIISPVLEQQVFADVLRFAVPGEFLDEMIYCHRERDICEYRFQVVNQVGINSIWLLTFFERRTFVAGVSISPYGFTYDEV